MIIEKNKNNLIRIAAIGVGGAGGNIIKQMSEDVSRYPGVELYAINTAAKDLSTIASSENVNKLLIGQRLTKGLGSGGYPDIGREAALESSEDIQNIIKNYDFIFILAGVGGGTGTGSSPVLADIARNLGVSTVSVVCRPFKTEFRNQAANRGIKDLKGISDLTIVISNENLKKSLEENTPFFEAIKEANKVMGQVVETIAKLIHGEGLINVDYNDLCGVIKTSGLGMVVSAKGKGELRAKNATLSAINTALLDIQDLSQAKSAIVNVVSGYDLRLNEYESIGEIVSSYLSPDARFVMGSIIDPDMRDKEILVNIILTGLSSNKRDEEVVKNIQQPPITKKTVDFGKREDIFEDL